MTRYEVLLFLHIAGATVWLGAAFVLQLLALRAERERDPVGLKRYFEDGEWLSNRVFIPSALLVLAAGIWLVIDGPWTFGQLWVLLALAGFAGTFLTGMLVMKPRIETITAAMERDGDVLSDETVLEIRRLFRITRIDVTMLYLVAANMVLKPTAGDVGTLVVLAAGLVAAASYSAWRYRSAAAIGAVPAREPA